MSVYNPQKPLPTDAISSSASVIQTNFFQADAQFGVDHTPFKNGSANGNGFHKQITLATKNTPGAQTDPSSVIYSGNGTASSVAQVFFRNQNSIYHLSPIKAWGVISSGALSTTQSYNVTNFQRTDTGKFSVVLSANAVSSNAFGVLATCRMPGDFSSPAIVGVASFAYDGGTGVSSFEINCRSPSGATGVDAYPISFIVLQL